MKQTFLIPALLLLGTAAIAQTTATPAPAQAAPAHTMPMEAVPARPEIQVQVKDPISSALRDALPGRLKNTIAAVESMPADKFDYKPTADQVTFSHLVAHMIEANYLLCSKSADVAPPQVDAAKETDGKDKLVAALKASFDFCSEALAKMDDSKLGQVAGVIGGQQFSRGRFALGLVSNWADHYAEAAMYLRLNGILPPTAKK